MKIPLAELLIVVALVALGSLCPCPPAPKDFDRDDPYLSSRHIPEARRAYLHNHPRSQLLFQALDNLPHDLPQDVDFTTAPDLESTYAPGPTHLGSY